MKEYENLYENRINRLFAEYARLSLADEAGDLMADDYCEMEAIGKELIYLQANAINYLKNKAFCPV